MEERILALAAEITGGDGEDPLLTALCAAAETAWRGRLRPSVTAEDCGEAFLCAAAFTAAADYLLSRAGGDAASFTVGAVSVKTREGGSGADLAEALRQAAERIMAPYGEPEGFSFRGVRG